MTKESLDYACGYSPHWEIVYTITKVVFITDFRHQLQITNALNSCHLKRMDIDYSGKSNTTPLPPGGFRKEIYIKCDDHPAEKGCSVQQRIIRHSRCRIFLGSHNIHATAP